jgi:hypothetical protein
LGIDLGAFDFAAYLPAKAVAITGLPEINLSEPQATVGIV